MLTLTQHNVTSQSLGCETATVRLCNLPVVHLKIQFSSKFTA